MNSHFLMTRRAFRAATVFSCGGLLVVSLLALSGCNKKVGSNKFGVQGKVTYKNAPVTGGALTFHLSDGSFENAVISPDGTYSTQLPAGTAKVTVNTESLKDTNAGMPRDMKGMSKEMQDKMKEAKEYQQKNAAGGTYVAIPKKYTDKNSTPLSIEVKETREQTIDIPLTD
jgi:hypothetical protein